MILNSFCVSVPGFNKMWSGMPILADVVHRGRQSDLLHRSRVPTACPRQNLRVQADSADVSAGFSVAMLGSAHQAQRHLLFAAAQLPGALFDLRLEARLVVHADEREPPTLQRIHDV